MASIDTLAACQPQSFLVALPGAHVINIAASPILNYSVEVPQFVRFVQPPISVVNANFCNITVTYTHNAQDDIVNVEVWLPLDEWSERLVAVGGAGWVAGRSPEQYLSMAGILAEGYATVTTDAGLGSAFLPDWALKAPGLVDMNLVENLGHVALGDEVIIAKSLIKSFYGRSQLYSYWNGCSQGGRQGLALAQLYPDAFDGIVVGAPGIHFPKLMASLYWPQQFMKNIDAYPYGCELDAITVAARSYCDGLDGQNDGLTANANKCLASFDPFIIVDQQTNCSQTGTVISVSHAAAQVVNATWNGIYSSTGELLWPGLGPGSDLTGGLSGPLAPIGLAMTNCTGDVCTGLPVPITAPWFTSFVAKDPNFDLAAVTQEEYVALLQQGEKEYSSILGSADPDLTAFRDAGGKIVSFHGLLDNALPFQISLDYYDSVSDELPNAHDFFRHFNVPGLGHCFGGLGGQPVQLFDQLRAWVENGTAPEKSMVSYPKSEGGALDRALCPYPKVAKFQEHCGDASSAKCWKCKTECSPRSL